MFDTVVVVGNDVRAELAFGAKESAEPVVEVLLDLALVPTLALVSLQPLSLGVLDPLAPPVALSCAASSSPAGTPVGAVGSFA